MSGDSYRPELWWRATMCALAVRLVIGALVLLIFLSEDGPMISVGAIPMAALGSILLLRVGRVRVTYSSTEIEIVGPFATRVIARGRVEHVDQDVRSASISWTTSTGGRVTSPLTALQTGTLGWIPARSRRERQRFLTQLVE